MTPPKQNLCCPLCPAEYTYIGKHLKNNHGLKNIEERKILMKYCNGRINIRKMPCPVDGCGYVSTRLDRHIDQAHPEVEAERTAQMINDLKYQVTMQMLRALRATNPSPPMVSRLDINPEATEEANQHRPTFERLPEDPSPSSCTRCQGLQAKNLQLTTDLGELRKKLLCRYRWAERAKKAIKRLEEALQKRSTGPVPSVDLDALEDEASSSDEEPERGRRSKSKEERRTTLYLSKEYPKFPPSILEYITDYWQHLKGTRGLKKKIENQKSKVGRIMMFLSFITEGRTILPNWTFLPNISRIYQWPEHLLNESKAENTVKAYLVNVSQFLTYFRDNPPSSSRVPKTAVFTVLRAISECISNLASAVVIRQIQIKKRKLSRAIPKDQLHLCKVRARRRIPELLDELAEDPKPETRRSFFGYLSVYIASLYGHRTSFLKNMTVSEVDEAQKEATVGDVGFVINVKKHKTNQAFGPAQLYLTPEEFSWVEQWVLVREKLNPPTDLLLFTENFTKIEKLIVPMQAAWRDMGLPGCPTFNDFLTSTATYARNILSPSTWSNISKTVCHGTRSADKHHALHLSALQLAQIREDFELAIKPSHMMGRGTDEPPLLTLSESSCESDDQGNRSQKKKLPHLVLEDAASSSPAPRPACTRSSSSSSSGSSSSQATGSQSGSSQSTESSPDCTSHNDPSYAPQVQKKKRKRASHRC
ncbi:uncharacterized protein LOC105923806 [Fundulus heteroclitus]|uniref:uncharacterized protein LOC105923806 n=1 Tax=Fundulus heteroclitus TaxID=8078 RepID=UPI00165B5B47|nr:uncharacterized protein LOC105923806 [Fundulus heteroclitus]